MTGLSPRSDKEKTTILPPRKILDIQTASGVVSSDAQAQIYIKGLGTWIFSLSSFGGRISANAVIGKARQRAWLFLFLAVWRDSQVDSRKEDDKMLHRERLRVCFYRTQIVTIY